MAKQHTEISRFHQGGKTFFFNRGEARNGNSYLAIKGLWGKGNQEQLVLFPGQMVEFYQNFKRAMEDITGLAPGEKRLVQKCGKCDAGPARWRTLSSRSGEIWVIFCEDCRELVFENIDGAWENHLKEEYDDSSA